MTLVRFSQPAALAVVPSLISAVKPCCLKCSMALTASAPLSIPARAMRKRLSAIASNTCSTLEASMHGSPQPPPKIAHTSAAAPMIAPTRGAALIMRGSPWPTQAAAVAVIWIFVTMLAIMSPTPKTRVAAVETPCACLLHGIPGDIKPEGGHGGSPGGNGGNTTGGVPGTPGAGRGGG